jgi:DNA-binding Xre family transcriptional regulator
MKRKGLEIISRVKHKIRTLMGAKNLTETELAERMDMSQQNLNRIMNKSNDIKLSTVGRAADAIGVDISEILSIVQNNNDNTTANTQENNVTVNDKKSLDDMLKYQNEINLEMIKLLKSISDKLDKI